MRWSMVDVLQSSERRCPNFDVYQSSEPRSKSWTSDPRFFKRKFSDFENMLNNNPPLSTKNIANNYSCIIFIVFFGMKSENIPLLQRIRDYNCRCSSHADDPLVFFDNFVERQSIRSDKLRRNTLKIPLGVGRTFKSDMDMKN